MSRPPKDPPDDSHPQKVEWSEAEEAWHDDSSLPAATEIPELAELVEPEYPDTSDETADDEADDDEGVSEEAEAEAPTEVPEPSRRRSQTIPRKQMLRDRRRMLAQGTLPEILEYERPQNRSACRSGDRPCLYVSCRYHLYLDVNPATGSIKINFPDKQIWELEETCALDVAERGGVTLEEVGVIMNLTRERIRQVEVTGLEKLKTSEKDLETFLDGREIPVHRDALPVLAPDGD